MILTSHVVAAVDFMDLDVTARTHTSGLGRLEFRFVSKINSVSFPLFLGRAFEFIEALLVLLFRVTLVLRVAVVFRVSISCSKALARTALFTRLSVMERDVAD